MQLTRLLYSNIQFSRVSRIDLNTCVGYHILTITSANNVTKELGYPSDIVGEHCYGISCIVLYDSNPSERYGFQMLVTRANKLKCRWIYSGASQWF